MKIINKSELTPEKIEQVKKYVPKRYEDAWLENAPEKVKEWLEKDGREKRSLFIYGKCGTGKTYIVFGIKKNLLLLEDRDFTIWNSTKLASIFRDESMTKSEYDRNYTLENLLKTTDRLIIDDFCAEKYSEFLEECFYRIMNDRWESTAPMMITSNFSLKEISDRIGDRIASRIAGMCDIIELTGEDKRLV